MVRGPSDTDERFASPLACNTLGEPRPVVRPWPIGSGGRRRRNVGEPGATGGEFSAYHVLTRPSPLSKARIWPPACTGFVGFVGAMLAGSPNIRTAWALKIVRQTVPIFVPTPRIEAFLAVASDTAANVWKPMKTSGLAQCLAILGNVAKSLKVRGFLVRDQEVGGSNPLAPTNSFQ